MSKDPYSISLKADDDDPYSQFDDDDSASTLKMPASQSKWQRKMVRLKAKLGDFNVNFQNGAFMGAMVGGSFGFIVGIYQSFVSRSIWMLPLSTVISGVSFGFIMGCGSIIRSDVADEAMKQQMHLVTIDALGRPTVQREMFWEQRMLPL